MPDWSYRTFLRPLLLARGEERGRRTAVRALRTLSRLPFGRQLIDFMGHMRADPRLRTPFGEAVLPGPVILGAGIDPTGEAIGALERFGVGMIEIDGTNEEEVAKNLESAKPSVPVCIRVTTQEAATRLQEHATFFVLDHTILYAGDAVGVWLRNASADDVRALREQQPEALIVAGGVTSPDDARRLLDAGANAVAVDAGLLSSGPGLVKRCNEALLSTQTPPAPPEPFTLDAARSAWFWAFLLGIAMFAGGVLALIVASTRVVLPYDESMAGLTRAQLHALNPRLLPFMAHDRVSLAGTMISIGVFYAALAWFGIRRGEHWAHVTVIVSAAIGFFSFFFFLGFGYFDPFHAFVTAILTQFMLLCMILPLSPRQIPVAEWHESAAWRRGQWGQLLFILIGVAITGSGAVISFIGCTSVFVATDLAFLRTTAETLRQSSFAHLVPLIAHDRASLGGMLLANGVTIWLAAQWGFRAGARWLWSALAWGGNIAFAAATIVHFVVGYGAVLHLTPAFLGWLAWNAALALTRGWLTARDSDPSTALPSGVRPGRRSSTRT
jgi:hypothetical protein